MNYPKNLVNVPQKFLPSMKKALVEKVPLLTPNEIRRLKIPLGKAFQLELQEENFTKGLELFNKIISIDESHLNIFRNKKNHDLLLEIFDTVKILETQSNEDEIETVMSLVKKNWNLNENFDWLIELLLLHATQLIVKYQLSNTKIDAIVKYHHAMFLKNRLNWYCAALIQFEILHQMVQTSRNWIFEGKNFSSLVSQQLADCLTKHSKQLRRDESNVYEPFVYSERALVVLRKNLDDENVKYEVDAEIEYAACWYDDNHHKSALSHYNHALALAEAFDLREKICECLIEISKCHRNLKDIDEQLEYLQKAKELADANSFTQFKGQISFKLTRYHVENYNFEMIEKYFHEARDAFENEKDQGKLKEIEELYAYGRAKFTFNHVVDSILIADKEAPGSKHQLMNLTHWMDGKPLNIDDNNSDDFSLELFIKKYYDPDEVTKI